MIISPILPKPVAISDRSGTDTKFDALVAAIYAAAIDPSSIQELLHRLRAAFDASGTAILVRDRNYKLTNIEGIDDRKEAACDYATNWSGKNPLEASTEKLPAGGMATESMQIPFDELKRLDFYNDFLCKHDLPYLLSVKIRHSDCGSAMWNLLRDSKAGPFQYAHFQLAQRLTPHFENAVEVAERIGHRGISRQTRDLADLVATPLMLLDNSGRVLHANPASKTLLKSADGLRITAKGLQAERASRHAELERCLGLATAGDADGRLRSGSLLIDRPSGKRPFTLVVIPFQSEDNVLLRRNLRALVTIIDPEGRSVTPIETLQVAYGLTSAESRVAAGIGAGHDLAWVANQLGITVDSSRQYLQRVFRKTETNRQGELVRLLTLLGALVT